MMPPIIVALSGPVWRMDIFSTTLSPTVFQVGAGRLSFRSNSIAGQYQVVSSPQLTQRYQPKPMPTRYAPPQPAFKSQCAIKPASDRVVAVVRVRVSTIPGNLVLWGDIYIMEGLKIMGPLKALGVDICGGIYWLWLLFGNLLRTDV